MLDEFGCEWVGARQSYVGSCGGLAGSDRCKCLRVVWCASVTLTVPSPSGSIAPWYSELIDARTSERC
jgi:hypothetical protein